MAELTQQQGAVSPMERKITMAEQALDFDAVQISIASAEEILERSHGNITKPETINYRTQKPERDGLFDEKVFGPSKDWECYCGKYKKIRYKGIVCDKCGVEVTRSAVRRERMGHIELAVPVAHIWFVRGVPSTLGLLLDLSVADLEKIIYFAGFIVLDVNESLQKQALEDLEAEYKEAKEAGDEDEAELTKLYKETKSEIEGLKTHMIISESKAQDLSLKYGQIVRVGIGAEAIYEILRKFDLNQTIEDVRGDMDVSVANRRRHMRRLRLLIDLQKAGIKPESLVMTNLPVIPPDLRPMVQLDGGRYAASDLNDLYRRVINRNNRLKRLIATGAPEVINRNEKRMLQEAVDALIDNSARRGRAVTSGTQRRLRSLSDMLRGKQGRFRQNLLGKRVDYSGRSVIVVGPELKLDQCGLPKVMALELFKPFVISRLTRDGFAHNVKSAQRMIERGEPQVWDILESITQESFVLLNRAPTLHRLGIQAFRPLLIEGKAIKLHPLVCVAFNADFDGDQMAVHVPLSAQAVDEARNLMWSRNNLLKPTDGSPVVTPRLDMVLGCYTLTTYKAGVPGEGKIFASRNEAILAYQMGDVNVRAKIKVRLKKSTITGVPGDDSMELIETSVGRVLINNLFPEGFAFINEQMDAKQLKKIVAETYKRFGNDETATLVDRIMTLGFEHAGLSGMTFSITDVHIPTEKQEILDDGDDQLEKIEAMYSRGLITDTERSAQVIAMWGRVKALIEKAMLEQFPKDSPVYIMMTSGARGTLVQVTQMAGMKGVVTNPAGEIIEIPIKGNFKEGLSVLEYFISSHGARKGRSDTALKTADAGYLTRRLVDIAQDLVVSVEDCGTTGAHSAARGEDEGLGAEFADRLIGRIAAADIKLPGKKTVLVARNEEINEEAAAEILASDLPAVSVRSVMFCEAKWGLCQRCYGRDLASGSIVKVGEAVGIMAAQAIGEPATQLTLKNFHMGGVQTADITTGLPRIEELFESRLPKHPSVLSEIAGRVEITEQKETKTITVISTEKANVQFTIEEGYEVAVKNGEQVMAKQAIATAPNRKAVRSSLSGAVSIKGNLVTVTSLEPNTASYTVPSQSTLKVAAGDIIERGQELTEGHWELGHALTLRGKVDLQRYIIKNVQEIYASQGITIHDKHIEIIVRQMFSKVRIAEGGASEYLPGQIVERTRVIELNKDLISKKLDPVQFEETVLGLTRVALKTESFLAAASFQETTTVLLDAAIRGAIDPLRGLKENVIIGKLIPAGTGFHAGDRA